MVYNFHPFLSNGSWHVLLHLLSLYRVLPNVINHSQGAFIDAIKLLFNVLLCQEIARAATEGRSHQDAR